MRQMSTESKQTWTRILRGKNSHTVQKSHMGEESKIAVFTKLYTSTTKKPVLVWPTWVLRKRREVKIFMLVR